MGLIKAAQTTSSQLKAFSMADIETQAQVIVARARQQAEQILAQAKASVGEQKIIAFDEARAMGAKKGYDEGFAKGLVAGKQEGFNKLTQAMQSSMSALTSAASTLDAIRAANLDKMTRDALTLTFMLVEKITRRRGMLDPGVIEANLAEAIRLVGSASRIRVAISPRDRKTIDEMLPKIKSQWPNLREIDINEDSAVSPGGCRVHTAGGEIDATLDEQLSRIAADLLPGEIETEG